MENYYAIYIITAIAEPDQGKMMSSFPSACFYEYGQ